MTANRFKKFEPSNMAYAKLTNEQERQLVDVEPSISNDLEYWPCRAEIKGGEIVENVYFVKAQKFHKHWGVWPEDDPNKKSIVLSDVVSISPSPNRLPVRFANKIYSAGESGMGYTVFTLSFSDDSRQSYIGGGGIDFLKLSDGKLMTEIIDVEVNNVVVSEKSKVDDYCWCLYEAD